VEGGRLGRPYGPGCGCGRSASCSRSPTGASVPAATPRPCCERLAEVRAELDRLRALETELTRLLSITPTRPVPTRPPTRPPGGAPPTAGIPASHREGGDRHAAAGLPMHVLLFLRRLPARLLLDQRSRPRRDRHGATGLAATGQLSVRPPIMCRPSMDEGDHDREDWCRSVSTRVRSASR
jgi:hypothetical protein